MLFNSLEFLLFFPLVFLLYFNLPARARWGLLLVASYIFYASWNPFYTGLIVFSTLVDYFAAIKLEQAKTKRARKGFLLLSLCSNLGLLGFFKYYAFFSGETNRLLEWLGLGAALPYFNLLLPVGISFYTFQTMSYSIDVYRGKREAERHLGYFALYVTFFPQLVAGPIERSTRLLPQLRSLESCHFEYDRVRSGMQLAFWGMFKKIVVADWLAEYVDTVYATPEVYGGVPCILATYFFAFQIYYDFSAYSDIARGCARIFGIELMVNFRTPYHSRSIKEFWQRWHISLSTWFRDYVYFPLGGNRRGFGRTAFNLLVVFLVSGVWHGANWTFLIWGGIHGALIIGYIATQRPREKLFAALRMAPGSLLGRVVATAITFHVVLISWVFFRAESLSDAVLVLGKFTQVLPLSIGDGQISAGMGRGQFLFLFAAIGLVSVLEFRGVIFKLFKSESTAVRWVTYVALCALLLAAGHFEPSQFLYFQF